MISHPSSASAGNQDPIAESLPNIQEPILIEVLSLLDKAVCGLTKSGRKPRTKERARSGLYPEGVVVISEDHEGIARAVAADLRALGHPVVRVRHGVGGGSVQGVNLLSAALSLR